MKNSNRKEIMKMLNNVGTHTLETSRLILRRFEITDAEDMFNNWANDDEVTKYLTWTSHKNIDETRDIISQWVKEYNYENYYQWCIEFKENKQAIGSIGIVKLIENIDSGVIGYVLSKSYWNKGIMTEALIEVEKFLFEQANFNRLQSWHDILNLASGRVMVKSGMQFEGVARQFDRNNKGEFCDCSMYAILKDDFNFSSVFIREEKGVALSLKKIGDTTRESDFDFSSGFEREEKDIAFNMNNIILCGFMGCGKTTVGKLVSQKMNMSFIDTDEYIESKMEMDIQKIFEKYSEGYFRKIEKEAIKDISSVKSTVIATGGGTILDIENYYLLKSFGKIIFLNLPFDKIFERIKCERNEKINSCEHSIEFLSNVCARKKTHGVKNDDSRPLFSGDKKNIENLFLERINIYRSRADVIIDASGSLEDVCNKILKVIDKKNCKSVL